MAVLCVAGLCLRDGGIWLRWAEAIRTKEVVEILGIYRDYRDQRLSDPAAPRLDPGAVVAAEELTADWAAILERVAAAGELLGHAQSVGDNDEWDLRIALNSYLSWAKDRPAFLSDKRPHFPLRAFRARGAATASSSRAARFATELVRSNRGAAGGLPGSEPTCATCGCPGAHAPPGDQTLWTECQDGPFWAIWEYRTCRW